MIQTGNIFEFIPKNLEQEVFELIAHNENVKIERIISRGQRSPESGWYKQEKNEWVIVLTGEAIIEFESGDLFKLKAGDYVNIPALIKHKVTWTIKNTETIWLAVHY